MTSRPTSAALFALHQLTVTMGILLLPVALLLRQVGVTVPVHRLVERSGEAYRKRKLAR